MEYDYAGIRFKKNAPTGITFYPFQGYEIDPSGVITKYIRVGGEALASKKGANKFFYHNDHLGSVNVITDAAGARCQLTEYDPWGSVSRSDVSSPPCEPTHRFTGQQLDPETGLYYYGGRYYDAEIGRFVSGDPFVQTPYDPQNLNRYTYVLNNPQNYIDPDGYFHRVKKPSFFKKFAGFLVGGLVLLFTGDPMLAYIATSVVQGGVNGGAAGAAMGLFTAGAYAFGGPVLGAVFQSITAEMTGGEFGDAFGDALLNSLLSGGFGTFQFSSSSGGTNSSGQSNPWDWSGFGVIRTAGDDDGPAGVPRHWSGKVLRFPWSNRYDLNRPGLEKRITDANLRITVDELQTLAMSRRGVRVYNTATDRYQVFQRHPNVYDNQLLRISIDATVTPPKIVSTGRENISTFQRRLAEGQYIFVW